MIGETSPTFAHRRRHRLTQAREYRTAYAQGLRRSIGPLTVFAHPNGRDDHRLGLSVGRRVGGAIARNRVKRLLREAFRLERPNLESGPHGPFDLVVTVRPHRVMQLERYREALRQVCARAARDLAKRETRKSDTDG